MLTNRVCIVCKKPFRPADLIVRVERIYHVGNLHTEATEQGYVAHFKCP